MRTTLHPAPATSGAVVTVVSPGATAGTVTWGAIGRLMPSAPAPPSLRMGRGAQIEGRQSAAGRAGAAAFSAAMAAHNGTNLEDSDDGGSSEEEVFTEDDRQNSSVLADCNFSASNGGALEGRLAVPLAVASVSSAQVQRRFRQAAPGEERDLRRFVRAGDILNYLGGNRWGHVVMALDPPQAFEVPVLYSAERLPPGQIPLDVYQAKLTRVSLDEPWGFAIEGEEDAATLVASATAQLGAAVGHWNAGTNSCSPCGAAKIRPEDHIVEVNGVRGFPADLLKACECLVDLDLKIWHPGLELKVIGLNVSVYAIKVLQSASNMRDIAESTVCLVVHPMRHCICAAGPTLDGFRVNLGHQGPVEVQVLLSPLDNLTMDFHLFRLAVNEVFRAPHDQKWSMRTAVRSYLRNAAIKPEKYAKANAKVKLGAKLSDHWAVRPICSTVPARIWQKYFLKRVYKERSCRASPDGGAGSFSAEAAFADEVIKYMPVKDDRVLPVDLVSLLIAGGHWDTLDLQRGPPARRMTDRPEPAPREELKVYGTSGSLRRAPLQAGTRNRDGLPVHLGLDNFTVYCGHQVSRRKKATARLFDADGEPPRPAAKIQWDGRCGPQQGPQCAACRWFEDRLIA
mmetsp:Transcript_150937/g.485048  ORF Transcript_150937/g.485048 Transcript_150937/m.485048 type:complete len:625 (+) Transcript_150937:186-2060(+)